ncbi:HAMP domain-containing histidine kinase [Arcanobacterium phocisimile]|uniref:histidine kinase n=2 Tax=Arcanobacterium phocisimile TaxID=1302235 RepID=A0ABX7IKV7_9ACTO|nr:HAMP domain-containing histidine kinase [Arcanobacterium phocisimile]
MVILLVTLTTLCGISAVMWLWTYRLLRKTRQQNATLQQRVLSNLVSPAYLSHEIRTPLTVIKGASEILTTGDLGPISSVQRQFLNTIAENSATACALAEDFLVLFRMEKSLATVDLVKIDLRQLIREAVHEFRIMHPCDIRLDNHGAPIFVEADPRMLKQVVWNLLTNSIRHGGKNVQTFIRVSSDDGIALVVVEDNGKGITARPSSPQASPSALEVHDDLPQAGSGIGMKVVDHIIAAHRGRLIIDTVLGSGTQVLIQLPIHGTHSFFC